MVQITIRNTHKGPSSEKAIAFAKMLMANKRQAQEEIREFGKTLEYKKILEELREERKVANAPL